jgi:choline dehydrogenase-like flavoprotein
LDSYHIVAIGSGFATSFFLDSYLRQSPGRASVLVLERGPFIPHATRLERRMVQQPADGSVLTRVGNPLKEWIFTIGFGGSSNAWWACTPRQHPNDFKLKTLYGVGRDWPISYDDLEEDYCLAEEVMQVSGPSGEYPYPRSRPYPQPPHNFTDPDRLLKRKYPTLFFNQPTARARIATGSRPPCCANAFCDLCPEDAKFTIENGFPALYKAPGITLLTDAEVTAIEINAGTASGVRYRRDGREIAVNADLVVLGANAIFNPFLMLKSGMDHPLLGRRLAEQASTYVDIDLKGVENFQGSTSITGHGYMFYDGDHRRERGACLVESWNDPRFRLEPGRWRERLRVKLIVEDLPQEAHRVDIDPLQPSRPRATFHDFSPYAQKTIARVHQMVGEMVSGLPVERIFPPTGLSHSDGHIECTTVMGTDPKDSVVDASLISHQVRNLLVLGASTFPTAAPANPTLTVAALSIYAARRLASSAAL